MKTKLKRGFTLIELLVVITIIAILASIAVPAYNGITKRAKQMKVVSNAKQIVLALKTFAIDNDGRYPNSNQATWPKWKSDGTNNPHGVATATDAFDILIPEYMPSEKIFYSSANTGLTQPTEDEDLVADGVGSVAYDYVDKLNDSSSGAAVVITETLAGPNGATHPWITEGKVIVAYNDGSSEAASLNARVPGGTLFPVVDINAGTPQSMLQAVPAGLMPSTFTPADVLVP